jgi:very-short-patch-repair endonuclease
MARHSDHKPVGRAVWTLARRQHGVVTRSQLLELGLTRDAIAHRIRTGRLHPLHRGVLSVGTPEVSHLGRWMAAVLACGPESLLSHQSAAELWGMRSPQGGRIEVSVPIERKPHVREVRVHRRRVLTATDWRLRHRIPVTSPARTLADLATDVSPHELEAAVNEADRLDLIGPGSLRTALDQMVGQHGVPVLRRLLDRRTFRLTDSELERRFLGLMRSAKLPRPETRQVVNGFRVDFYWPDLGLIVETDGLRYHRTPSQQARDHRRDQAHATTGLTTLRFTHAQVRFEPVEVVEVLRRVVARLAARRGAA